ncbi:MAG: nickel pincer cofactor biosynthesis protein LarB [Candidatus Omnitrophica bacterium]|nr:nickel pincer cofactor biosynthesis protein LarB [Candidatus Omnitrophota bacterium]
MMVSEQRLQRWLRDVRAGRRSPRSLVERLKRLPFEDVGFARLDTHRRLRRGLPEVIFCDGKTPQQLAQLTHRLARHGELILLTRLAPELYETLRPRLPRLRYHPLARLAYAPASSRQQRRGLVLVVTGGTSDLPVAEEAAITLEQLGSRAARLFDVGVAGIHRLLSHWRLLQQARAIVVIAGMEGALPSVVAGLVRCPVIAVPTSVGYGASFQGVAPLLTMLNSCVPGIGVVNIDNGFGAAYLAHLINRPPRG